MKAAFYDNREPLEDPATAQVDRVYCLDLNRFERAEWAVLDRVYRSLPGWQGYHDDLPYWFGTDEMDIPHLLASVEPSGLHVCGVLPAADWLAWTSRFGSAIAGLPTFECA